MCWLIDERAANSSLMLETKWSVMALDVQNAGLLDAGLLDGCRNLPKKQQANRFHLQLIIRVEGIS